MRRGPNPGVNTSAPVLMQTSQRQEGEAWEPPPAIRLTPGNESLLELTGCANGLGLHPSGD